MEPDHFRGGEGKLLHVSLSLVFDNRERIRVHPKAVLWQL